MASRRKRPERFVMRVTKGALQPADNYTCGRLREKGYRTGDIVSVQIFKARNPGFHRLVHQFGALVAENVEAFAGLDAHQVLKRIQLEANIGCEEIALNFPGVGPCSYRVPQSLGYANMDDGEFSEVYKAMCRHIAKTYWRGLDEDAIAQMAELMEAA